MESDKKEGGASYIAGDCDALHGDVSDSASREGLSGDG